MDPRSGLRSSRGLEAALEVGGGVSSLTTHSRILVSRQGGIHAPNPLLIQHDAVVLSSFPVSVGPG